MPSTNRSGNTVRCRADRLAASAQIAFTCSWTKAAASGDCCRSAMEFPISATSASECSERLQNFKRLVDS